MERYELSTYVRTPADFRKPKQIPPRPLCCNPAYVAVLSSMYLTFFLPFFYCNGIVSFVLGPFKAVRCRLLLEKYYI